MRSCDQLDQGQKVRWWPRESLLLLLLFTIYYLLDLFTYLLYLTRVKRSDGGLGNPFCYYYYLLCFCDTVQTTKFERSKTILFGDMADKPF